MPAANFFRCFTRLFVLLFFLAASCSKKTPSSSDCPPDLADQYQKISTQQTESPVELKRIIDFYNNTKEPCREQICRAVANDVFKIIYNFQPLDTLAIPFLNNMYQDRNLNANSRARALFNISNYYLIAQESPSKAEPYISLTDTFVPKMNDTSLKAYYSIKGEYCRLQSRLKESTTYFLKAIEVCERMKDSSALATIYSNFATVYSRMGEFEKAVAIRKKVAAYFQSQGNDNYLIYGYVGIAYEYSCLNLQDSALAYYKKGVDLVETKKLENPKLVFNLYTNIAELYIVKKDFAQARAYYEKAKGQLRYLNNDKDEQFYILASTPAFAVIKPVDSEIKVISGYIPTYVKREEWNMASNAYNSLYSIYLVQNKYEEALENYQKYDSLKSIEDAQENRKYVTEMETKYETQKKQLKIQVQDREIKKQNAINGLLIATLITLILLTALIFTRIRLKRNKKEALLQQKFTQRLIENTELERSRIARDLHDGVSQDLMILKNQFDSSQQSYKESIDAVINEIRLISRDLHPVMLEKIGLKASITHICEQLMEANLIFISSEIDYHLSLNKNGELQIFRMIQEALNNVIKYAKAQAAKVSVYETDKLVIAEIIDNGNGFDVAEALKSKSSFGLLNLTERSKALNGKTSISSSKSGTKITIEIPKTNV